MYTPGRGDALLGSAGASRNGEMGGMEGEEATTGDSGGGSDISAYVAEQSGVSRTTPSNVACPGNPQPSCGVQYCSFQGCQSPQ